ncbi:uncharacterized protein DNG_05159 [Cephalotrichum gorgonifer]|uniref:Uncharacterized protein n=1 Tax=Cephalotrichum gorgonifer TaxID=2041049 RepID=A0AAE8MXE7_9PEZI|nr:uncharacterized protein DNG_05159 [Cephalotrichum gorgonifer]
MKKRLLCSTGDFKSVFQRHQQFWMDQKDRITNERTRARNSIFLEANGFLFDRVREYISPAAITEVLKSVPQISKPPPLQRPQGPLYTYPLLAKGALTELSHPRLLEELQHTPRSLQI